MKQKKQYAKCLAVLLCVTLLLSSCKASYKKQSGYAMGALVSVTAESEECALDAVLLVAALEREISHKIPDSTVSALNRGESVLPSPTLLSALSLSLDVEEKTNGAFSVRLLPLTSLWDFENGVVPSDEDVMYALEEIKQSTLTLTPDTVTLSSGGIDLGAIGKGMAADALILSLKEKGEEGVVAVGGSIGVSGNKNGEGWRIGVRDPHSASKNDTVGILRLSDTFVSTSGSYEKAFTKGGKSYHHILDTQTGMPIENDIVSVTVVAESGVLSDILSTALYAVGTDLGVSLCQAYGAEALFIKKDGTLWATEGFSALFSTEKEVNLLGK